LATGKDFLTLRDVIRRLDVPRRQVFIEAMVMELSISKSRDLGLSYHGAIPGLGGLVIGGLKSGSLSSLNPLSLLSMTGLVGGLVGPQISSSTIFGQGSGTSSTLPPQFGILVQAMQTNNDVNVMQVPNILTTDNEKSTITVGQNLPFPSAITGGLPQAGAAGALAGFTALQSVQRQDVQLKIEVTPHVSASETVRLELKTEISDIADKNFNGLGPATNKRTLETTAVVRDQQPVVLGGIMRDRIADAVTKIPVLGDIPILGYLFKTRSKEVQKQMLLIVLTPYVINDPAELQRIFERKTRERREFIEAYSAFSDDREVMGAIDYNKKRGALEEINRTAIDTERELIELRTAEQSLHREVVDSGPVELPPGMRSSGAPGPASPPASSPPPVPAQSKPVSPPPPPGAPPG
jgi:general secretion pathway protein D